MNTPTSAVALQSSEHHGAARTPRVIILGAGMSGLLAGIRLRQAGIEDFTIYEKSQDVGGTWRENRYPGLACDVPAHYYTYSFEPNPDWQHRFARGPEIQNYMRHVADKYDLRRHIVFGEEGAQARGLRDQQDAHHLVRGARGTRGLVTRGRGTRVRS